MCIDRVMYVWNPLYNAAGVQSTDHSQVIGSDPVTGGMMARKVLRGTTPCPTTLANALDTGVTPVDEETQLLSSQTRVLRATAQPLTDTRLVKLNFVIGTYSRSEMPTGSTRYLTATQSGGEFTCLPGSDGTYCAFAEFNTVVYLSKDQ